jgi:hypothetical protein
LSKNNEVLAGRNARLEPSCNFLDTLLRSAFVDSDPTIRAWIVNQIGELIVAETSDNPEMILAPLAKDRDPKVARPVSYLLNEYQSRTWQHRHKKPTSSDPKVCPNLGPGARKSLEVEKAFFLESLRSRPWEVEVVD